MNRLGTGSSALARCYTTAGGRPTTDASRQKDPAELASLCVPMCLLASRPANSCLSSSSTPTRTRPGNGVQSATRLARLALKQAALPRQSGPQDRWPVEPLLLMSELRANGRPRKLDFTATGPALPLIGLLGPNRPEVALTNESCRLVCASRGAQLGTRFVTLKTESAASFGT